MIRTIAVRLILAFLALGLAGWGGWLYRGAADARRAASQALEASTRAAKAATTRDTLAAQGRARAIEQAAPALNGLRGWQGGLRPGKESNAGTDEAGRGCVSDPWGSPEYLGVLGNAARAGNQAVESSRDLHGAVPGDS